MSLKRDYNGELKFKNQEKSPTPKDLLPSSPWEVYKSEGQSYIDNMNKERFNNMSEEVQQNITKLWDMFTSLPEQYKKLAMDRLISLHTWSQLSDSLQLIQKLNKIDFVVYLPNDLSLKVMSYLDAKSLCVASTVSKRWKAIAEEDSLWRHLCRQHTGQACIRCGWGLPKVQNSPKGIQPFKDVYAIRFSIAKNWKYGRYQTKEFSGHTNSITCIQADKDRIVTSSYDNTVIVWDLNTNTSNVLQGHSNCVKCIQVMKDTLVTGSMDQTIKVWSLKTFKCIRTIEASNGIHCLSFNKARIVGGSTDCLIRVWDSLNKGYCLEGHTDWVTSILLNDSVAISGSADHTIKFWDLEKRVCTRTLDGHQGQIQSLQLKGNVLMSGSLDNSIRIWDATTGDCTNVLYGHNDGVWCVRFDNIRIVTAAHDKTIKVWDMRTKAQVQSYQCEDEITCLELEETKIITGSEKGVLRIMDFSPENVAVVESTEE